MKQEFIFNYGLSFQHVTSAFIFSILTEGLVLSGAIQNQSIKRTKNIGTIKNKTKEKIHWPTPRSP